MTRRTLMPLTPLAVAAALAPHEPTARRCPSVTGRALEYRRISPNAAVHPESPTGRPRVAGAPVRWALQVLAGVGRRFDRPAGLGALAAGDERADVHDPLALLAGDPRPVVGVGGVGQVLVLPELVDAGVQQVLQPHALAAGGQELLDGH